MDVTRGCVVVTNGRAGSAEQQRVASVVSTLRAAGPVEVVETDGAGELDAVLDGVDERVLVVVGGDGSVHLVVQRLWARGQLDQVKLGLVPAGTGNDLARGLGLPLDAGAAARGICTGRPRRLDLLVDQAGGVVVNAVHAGLGAEAARVAARWKPRLGPLAYPVGALGAGLRRRGWRLTVEVDGQPVGEADATGDTPGRNPGRDGDRTLQVGVCNGPTIGGGTRLCPPARPEDGWLDVVVVRATGLAARAGFARALRAGRHLDRPDVQHRRGREVSIRGEAVRFNADGEVSAPTETRTYRVVPGAWTLLAP